MPSNPTGSGFTGTGPQVQTTTAGSGYTGMNNANQAPASGFSSSNMKGVSGSLNFFGDYSATITAGKMSVADASWNRFQAARKSRLLLQNAKKRMAQGSKEAGMIQYQGRVVESDAIAAMAGQGGTTDPVMLAKMKQVADYNSLQALFSATSDAGALKREARNVTSQAEMQYMRAKTQQKIDRYAATANMITNAMGVGMSAYG